MFRNWSLFSNCSVFAWVHTSVHFVSISNNLSCTPDHCETSNNIDINILFVVVKRFCRKGIPNEHRKSVSHFFFNSGVLHHHSFKQS